MRSLVYNAMQRKPLSKINIQMPQPNVTQSFAVIGTSQVASGTVSTG